MGGAWRRISRASYSWPTRSAVPVQLMKESTDRSHRETGRRRVAQGTRDGINHHQSANIALSMLREQRAWSKHSTGHPDFPGCRLARWPPQPRLWQVSRYRRPFPPPLPGARWRRRRTAGRLSSRRLPRQGVGALVEQEHRQRQGHLAQHVRRRQHRRDDKRADDEIATLGAQGFRCDDADPPQERQDHRQLEGHAEGEDQTREECPRNSTRGIILPPRS